MSLLTRAAIFGVALLLGTQLSARPTCTSEIGSAAAKKLVDRCRNISPATHPPCNAANPCALIRDEINRSEVYAAQSDDIAAIRELRAQNNRALAAHDLDATMRIVGDDFVLVGGNSGIDRSRDDDRKAWAEEFARPGHDRYVRTPGKIEVGARKGAWRAAEAGTWEGIDHLPAGESRPFGSYFVHWSKATGEWKVVSETYVTLGCRGPGC